MSIRYMDSYVEAYKNLVLMMGDLNPALSVYPEMMEDIANYLRKFCFALIFRSGDSNFDGLDFVNNLTLSPISEMTENEYRQEISSHTAEHYYNYIYTKHAFLEKLIGYDKENNTELYKYFVARLCCIAKAFGTQRVTFVKHMDVFCSEYMKRLANHVNQTASTQSHTNNVPQRKTNTMNNLTAVAFVICFTLALVFIILGFNGFTAMFFFAIIPLIPLIAIIKRATTSKKCMRCGAINSFVTIKSELIDTRKIKVRRTLNSGYFRTSGTHTFGVRETFVSADEKTYRETYRCNMCGCEQTGTRKVIDDGIR